MRLRLCLRSMRDGQVEQCAWDTFSPSLQSPANWPCPGSGAAVSSGDHNTWELRPCERDQCNTVSGARFSETVIIPISSNQETLFHYRVNGKYGCKQDVVIASPRNDKLFCTNLQSCDITASEFWFIKICLKQSKDLKGMCLLHEQSDWHRMMLICLHFLIELSPTDLCQAQLC